MALGPAGTVEVRVEGDFSGFEGDLKRSGKRAGAGFGAAIGKAALAGGIAAAGKGVLDFAGFESSMNEVFTLLPDISEGAMSEMSSQVKDFSKEFGVLPNTVIPSLYDSLSAGVPPDNVFAFLEQANKLAKAGATDTGVAVDALTGVINAYGAENIDAAKASDLVFATVKAGKTTVEELGSNLAQVTPIAASLGVGFDQVSASMATITAVTGNTSTASTQLKSALAELGKDGSVAFKNFEKANGETFPEFIARGGDLGQGLVKMGAFAESSGTSLGNMFGSVEAGQAALVLAADGAATFGSNLEAMQGSAGATDTAFARMEQGLKPTLDRLKASLSVALIDLGESLAPVIEDLGKGLLKLIEFFTALPGPVQKFAIVAAIAAAGVLAFAGPMLKVIQLGKALSGVFTLLAANPWILAIGALVLAGIILWKNWDTVKEKLSAAWEAISATATTIFNGIKGFFSQWWPLLLGIFTGGIGLVVGLIIQNWDAIWTKTKEVWNGIKNFFGEVGSAIYSKIDQFVIAPVKAVIGFFESLPEIATTAWNGLKSAIEGVAEWIKTKLGEIGDAADRALGPIDEIIGAGAKLGGGIIGGVGGILGFDTGGVVPGRVGTPQLAVVHGGETVIPSHRPDVDMSNIGGGGGDSLSFGPFYFTGDPRDRGFFEENAVEMVRVVKRELDRQSRARGRAEEALR